MGAFQAIRDAEAVKNEQHFAEAKAAKKDYLQEEPVYNTPLNSISDSYKKGEYSGGEDRPTHNWRGRKIIKGFTTSQRIKGDQDRQDERDKFFFKAAEVRYDQLREKHGNESQIVNQAVTSYNRQGHRMDKRDARKNPQKKQADTTPKTGDS